MPDSLAAMLALFNDNTSGDISAADGRAIIQALHDWIPATERYKMGRLAGETAHAADDFFSTVTGYTDADVTGTSTWAATRGGATCTFASQSSNDLSVLVKAIPVAGVPITIETQIEYALTNGSNPTLGLIFTDGTAGTSNLAGFGVMSDLVNEVTAFIRITGTLTSASVVAANPSAPANDPGRPFVRLVWKSANTFAFAWSPDGETWTDFGHADFSTTFTPTHMGFFVSSWSQTGNQIASFRYLRVYEADLSV